MYITVVVTVKYYHFEQDLSDFSNQMLQFTSDIFWVEINLIPNGLWKIVVVDTKNDEIVNQVMDSCTKLDRFNNTI